MVTIAVNISRRANLSRCHLHVHPSCDVAKGFFFFPREGTSNGWIHFEFFQLDIFLKNCVCERRGFVVGTCQTLEQAWSFLLQVREWQDQYMWLARGGREGLRATAAGRVCGSQVVFSGVLVACLSIERECWCASESGGKMRGVSTAVGPPLTHRTPIRVLCLVGGAAVDATLCEYDRIRANARTAPSFPPSRHCFY